MSYIGELLILCVFLWYIHITEDSVVNKLYGIKSYLLIWKDICILCTCDKYR